MSCEVIETALTRTLCEVCVVFEPDTLSDSIKISCKASPSSSYETTSEEYHCTVLPVLPVLPVFALFGAHSLDSLEGNRSFEFVICAKISALVGCCRFDRRIDLRQHSTVQSCAKEARRSFL